MTVVLLLMMVGVAGPHLLPLERASPLIAAAIWLAALALRALLVLFSVLLVLLYIPATREFSLVTDWCWHGVMPLLATHLPLSGHALGNIALILPALVLAASAVAVAGALWRAARCVQGMIARSVVGPGPGQSLVLADRDVLVAAAGLRRPRIVVSTGALLVLDDEELAASLEHERGHIARLHRYILVASEFLRAAARFLPGTRTAARELAFQLERDADRFAIEARHHPAVLAGAICKAAQTSVFTSPSSALSGGSVRRRVELLLDDTGPYPSPARERRLRVVACVMLGLVVTASVALPGIAHAGLDSVNAAALFDHCPG